jgi:hypothetical protein
MGVERHSTPARNHDVCCDAGAVVPRAASLVFLRFDQPLDSRCARAAGSCGSGAKISISLSAGKHRIRYRMLDATCRALRARHLAAPDNSGLESNRISCLVALRTGFHH